MREDRRSCWCSDKHSVDRARVAITFMCTYVRVHLTTFVRTDVRARAQTTIRNVWIDRSANHITVNNIHEGRRSC